jgi:hypothetical protein
MDGKETNGKDVSSKTKTLYDAGYGEIFWKNFLAGLGRGLGGLFVWIIFLSITSILFINIVLPKLMPLINGYTNLLNTFNSAAKMKPESGILIPNTINLQKIFGQ